MYMYIYIYIYYIYIYTCVRYDGYDYECDQFYDRSHYIAMITDDDRMGPSWGGGATPSH